MARADRRLRPERGHQPDASVLLVVRLERVGERLGVSEALLGLWRPSPPTARDHLGGHRDPQRAATIGVGVTLGSNVFNLAALLGLTALVAGRIASTAASILLEGALGLWIALVGLAVVVGQLGTGPGPAAWPSSRSSRTWPTARCRPPAGPA